MEFGWNKDIKVQILQGGRPIDAMSTPKFMLANPHGFRMEDLLKALCEATTELINESEAKAESLVNVQKVLGEMKNEQQQSVQQEGQEERERSDDSQDIIYNTYEAQGNGQA
jgi:hypothetical protein